MSNSNYMSSSHRLGEICTFNIFSPSLIIGRKFWFPQAPPYPRAIFLKIEQFIPGFKERLVVRSPATSDKDVKI